jgi:[ribosomal protein S18]-alanine N-acetyltransferase
VSRDDTGPIVRPLATGAEIHACAEIMSTSEPWITLRRGYDAAVALLRDPERESYVAIVGDEVVGFVIIVMRGGFIGYIQSIGARADWRGRGVGTRLLDFAEARIFRDTSNVFLCVSSFNPRARVLYERRGYRAVGELTEFIVPGHSEFLMRKTIGPLVGR